MIASRISGQSCGTIFKRFCLIFSGLMKNQEKESQEESREEKKEEKTEQEKSPEENHKLERKLSLVVIVPLIALLSIITVLIVVGHSQYELGTLSDSVHDYADRLSLGEIPYDTIRDHARLELMFNEFVTASQLIDSNMTTSYSSGNTAGFTTERSDEIRRALNGNSVSYNYISEGRNTRVYLEPLTREGGTIGVLHIELSTERLAGVMLNYALLLLAIDITVLVVTYALTTRLFRMLVTRKVDMIRKAVSEIDVNNPSYRPSLESEDELGTLSADLQNLVNIMGSSMKSIKKHSDELEGVVNVRTDDLNRKVDEMGKTKTAILNMMDDMDVTNKELVETKGELEESLSKLKEVDSKKDQFISIAAHELKTPLTSIHGFSQLLHNDKVANSPEKRKKYLSIIDKESKRLANLVSEILDLSRIDLGTIKFLIEEVDINEVMESVQSEMDVRVKEAKLESAYSIEKNMPKILTDRERVVQILINIINNAVKYTPKGKITVSVKKDGKNIHFSVKDTGLGIAKEDMKKIFERFYQVDSSYTRKVGGTGLGLSLCKEFVTMLGGRIWVDSKVGEGSDFQFSLPISGAPEELIAPDRPLVKEKRNQNPLADGAECASDGRPDAVEVNIPKSEEKKPEAGKEEAKADKKPEARKEEKPKEKAAKKKK